MSNLSEGPAPQGSSAAKIERPTADEAKIQIFFGEATETGCRIYAQSERQSQAAAPLGGFVRGPFCQYAHTLPVSYPFRGGKASAAATVEAWVPDPCFWTPAMPFYYEYTVERDLGSRQERVTGAIGIRRLGREGANLRFDGKRWVLRAARAGNLESADLAAWHEASLAAWVVWPDRVSPHSATRAGVLLVVELPPRMDVERELRRLRSEAAVAVVVLDRLEAPLDPRSVAHNLLFAQRFRPGEPIRPDDWADIALCEMRRGEPWTESISGRRVPLVALRPDGQGHFADSARPLCDLLQRDLAEGGTNWAGYIV